jgi:hypothetical protein
MDISFWTQLQPKINVEHTTKKYFNQYLYKLVVYAPCGRTINSNRDIGEHVENRRVWDRDTNKFGHWGFRNLKESHNADIKFLEVLRNIKNKKSDRLKFRIEEPEIQIYAKNLNDLQDLVQDQFGMFYSHLRSIFVPENEKAEDLLNSGFILRKKDIGYKYKIILSDGRYSIDTKRDILNYLDRLDINTVNIPKSCYTLLGNLTHGHIWGCYFYSNDDSILTFLNLIAPGMISNIHELVVLDNK